MARFTNIGMPKKRFVASAAEEREAAVDEPREQQEAGPSKKRKGCGRDPDIASESTLAFPQHRHCFPYARAKNGPEIEQWRAGQLRSSNIADSRTRAQRRRALRGAKAEACGHAHAADDLLRVPWHWPHCA